MFTAGTIMYRIVSVVCPFTVLHDHKDMCVVVCRYHMALLVGDVTIVLLVQRCQLPYQ
jgi:hypothetical protein